MAKPPQIPADQFQRTVEELRKFNLIVDEVQRAYETTQNVGSFEAGRYFERIRNHLEEAGLLFGKVLKVIEGLDSKP